MQDKTKFVIVTLIGVLLVVGLYSVDVESDNEFLVTEEINPCIDGAGLVEEDCYTYLNENELVVVSS